MQVLLLDGDPRRQADIACALTGRGLQVSCMESLSAAELFVRTLPIEVLVLGERIGGRLSHSLALLAECRNPQVCAVLLTDREAEAADELFELIPAVRAILGCSVPAEVVGQVVAATFEARQVDEAQVAIPAEDLLSEMAGQMTTPMLEDADADTPGRVVVEPVLYEGLDPDTSVARPALAEFAVSEALDPVPSSPQIDAAAPDAGTVVPASMDAPDGTSFTAWLDWLDTKAPDENFQPAPCAGVATDATAPDVAQSASPAPLSGPAADPVTDCVSSPMPELAEAANPPEPQHFSVFWQRESWLRPADSTSTPSEPMPATTATSEAEAPASDLPPLPALPRLVLTDPTRRLHLA